MSLGASCQDETVSADTELERGDNLGELRWILNPFATIVDNDEAIAAPVKL
jgi:hypothetical protein